MKTTFKKGHEYLYIANKNIEPIWLTYVKKNKSEKDRHILFSSEYPSIDYDISDEAIQIGNIKHFQKSILAEEYVVFRDSDIDKKEAYQIMIDNRRRENENALFDHVCNDNNEL